MKQTSRYQYQKRINELENEKRRLRDRLEPYEIAAKEIYEQVVTNVAAGDNRVGCSTILNKLKRCLR